jgi:hypothetical protein
MGIGYLFVFIVEGFQFFGDDRDLFFKVVQGLDLQIQQFNLIIDNGIGQGQL